MSRYILRPALSNDRLTALADGRVRIALKKPFRDGTAAVEVPPQAFMTHLAAIIPTPRIHVVCYDDHLRANESPAHALLYIRLMSGEPRRNARAIALLAAAVWLIVQPEGHARAQGVGTASDPRQMEAPGPPPPWRWRLTLPGSGIAKTWRVTDFGDSQTSGFPVLLATLSRELASPNPARSWIVEGGLGWTMDRSLLRFVLRAGAGPSFRLLDSRRGDGRGSTLAVQAAAGFSYWGQQIEWIQTTRGAGQTLLGGMVQLGIEAVRFTSARSGWCIRLRGVADRPFLRGGSVQFRNSEGSLVFDDVRGNVAMYLDLGRAW